ncbi:MAG: Demethylrebeccamycin-D-glucose O-methyltransferase [Alphaproteobacteria bacterium MarineAlpha4_Bin2]|nr:MAG: Demethylrebeccamycin-D-glucose O-methyltransferase [Alphaproteobacteria bacterium MarineAlpha4_Bin2]
MFEEIDFVSRLHRRAERDYIGRVVEHDKAECAAIAKRYGADYWDGPRHLGYGGYKYDGRWRVVAEQMAEHYGLKPGMRILDVGCGKAFLLYEFTQVVPGIEVFGIDVSEYGIANAKEEVRPYLEVVSAQDLPFEDNSFDFVYSLATLHNLKLPDLNRAVQEIARVGKGGAAYIMVESYRNEREKVNLLYWQLTCESFYAPDEWAWVYTTNGYTGDYGFIYFE